MRILVLGGGRSDESRISTQSATAVRDALTDLGHEVSYLDPAVGEQVTFEAVQAADLVFPILHGAGGEDGEIQSLLRRAGKPFLGSDVEASARCFDKIVIKELLLQHGLPTPKFEVVSRDSIRGCELLKRPFVLKPIFGGSSIDTIIEHQPMGMTPEIENVFSRHHQMLMEELVAGVEITVPVLGDTALPVVEIVPPSGQEFNYENKYNGAAAEITPPKHVDPDTQIAAQRLAEKIHRLTGARHLSRTDMIVRSDGNVSVLEINTMPGMTAESLYPKAAAAEGLSFTRLVERFVELSSKEVEITLD